MREPGIAQKSKARRGSIRRLINLEGTLKTTKRSIQDRIYRFGTSFFFLVLLHRYVFFISHPSGYNKQVRIPTTLSPTHTPGPASLPTSTAKKNSSPQHQKSQIQGRKTTHRRKSTLPQGKTLKQHLHTYIIVHRDYQPWLRLISPSSKNHLLYS
ncbi:hypothetical protein TWF594_004967 [Orbilia oligospora]|nr:hypothetical protein TWF706_001721 [Orbilia oligospora]KAF3108881.1 hypothetical protein TWF706_001721 [Orbilia oligospora]KAF3143892.1 hypothetical protein TWF594_004967 [Orbilia oligospora]